MTYLRNVSITGFKAVEELEFQPNNLTLITGRNNSGKTSVLEAIDLLFNPSKIKQYDDLVGKLVNAKSEKAVLSCEYQKGTQLSLRDFDGDGNVARTKTRALEIKKPEPDRVTEIFISSVLDIVENSPDSRYFVDRFAGQTLDIEDESNVLGEIIIDTIKDLVTSNSESVARKAEESCIILTVDGVEYEYIYLGEFYSNYTESVAKKGANRIRNQIVESDKLPEQNIEEARLLSAIKDVLIPRFGKGRFVGDEPTSIDGIQHIGQSLSLDPENIDMNKEEAAVRLSNIEEYIKNNNIVKNLDTLSFDQLVFESRGDKYQVPFSFMGSGFHAIMGLLWALSNTRNSGNVLLIEEGENHLHPGYIAEFVHRILKIIMDENVQIFLTTHSLDLIRTIFNEDIFQEEHKYLLENFCLLQMNPPVTESYSYQEAQRQLNELRLDLRGL
ncbi:ATP-binding protein [Halobaculum sp. CBA1158]|uniref:ATP-binding protein n=1 Tax=Halobaculum sp. CBA1158 TaxID=2904243 RepID=UPI001F2C4919|nr:AAA family ATPase [Halobaculum sp. CBA1158]UIO99576.1 ATP-binding protein [Halobaculum sp. CBA1158]